MAICPSCQAPIGDNATECPRCGKRVIPADQLENVPDHTTGWQWVVIAVTTILLIMIAITYKAADSRENAAAQRIFSEPVAQLISNIAVKTGMAQYFGLPNHTLRAKTDDARIVVEFPHGALTQPQASMFGQSIAAATAQLYVKKGYMAQHIDVTVASAQPDGKVKAYGQAVYNGNIDALGWEPAAQ